MSDMPIIVSAALNFGRFDVAAMRDKLIRPCSMGAVPNQAKALSLIIPLASTTKQHPFFKGVFAFKAAVLRRDNSAEVGVTERANAILRMQGSRCKEPNSTRRASNRGYMRSYRVTQKGCSGCRLIRLLRE